MYYNRYNGLNIELLYIISGNIDNKHKIIIVSLCVMIVLI